MNRAFFDCLHSEWLKQRRSLAIWMVIAGAFFTPVIVLAARLLHRDSLPSLYSSAAFWTSLWRSSWESAAVFLLPMGAVFATSLIAQIEYRNNTWKQVHALPLSTATIYCAKLAIILAMLALFFVLFNLGIWLSAVVPALLPGVPYPVAPLPIADFLRDDLLFYVDCLPIVALQYLLALRFRHFLVPLGAGFLLWVATLGALPWRWGSLSPYAYPILDYLKNETVTKAASPIFDIHALALGYFLLFAIGGYGLFATRRMKG